MTKEEIEIFNISLSEYNGYLDIDNNTFIAENYKEEHNDVLDFCRTAVERVSQYFKNPCKIRLGLTNYSFLGAVTCKSENTYFIGIHAGSILILNALFSWMLRSSRVLPEIGDASKEQLHKLDDPHIIESGRLVDVILLDPTQYCLPNDPIRARMVGILTMNALVFLTMHELGHIFCGHLDHLIETKRQSSFSDSTNVDMLSNEGEGLKSQAKEIVADDFAVYFSLYKLQGTFEYMQRENDFSIFKDFPQLLGTWLFSISALFRLIGMREYDTSKLKQYSHPAPGFRSLNIMVELTTQIRNGPISPFCSPIHKNDIREFILQYLSNVEDAFEDINLYRAKAAEGAELMSFALTHPEHVADVLKAIKDLKEELRPFVMF